MPLHRRLIQLRDLFAMRAHAGWLHYLLRRSLPLPGPQQAWLHKLNRRFERYTDHRTAQFDHQFGTETFTRRWVRVSEDLPMETLGFGYGPVNQDFCREILRALPIRAADYCFVDVGAGKGAAIMVASERGFQSYLALELDADLAQCGRDNVARYQAATGRHFEPEWVVGDFMKWPLPNKPCVLFLNNPFPPALSLAAVQRIEALLPKHPHPLLLVFRKAPKLAGDHLHRSPHWEPIRLAPYWRIYRAHRTDTAA